MKIKHKKIINKVAKMVYESTNGKTSIEDFYKCYTEYKAGRFGWIKEHNSFVAAINIYNLLNADDIVFLD